MVERASELTHVNMCSTIGGSLTLIGIIMESAKWRVEKRERGELIAAFCHLDLYIVIIL